jgi:hypothetical protein
MKPLRPAIVAAALLALAIAGFSLGVLWPSGTALVSGLFAATPLSDAELQRRLQAQGFSDLQNFRHEGNRVIVTATRNGETDQLVVDPSTGQPIRGSGDADDDD